MVYTDQLGNRIELEKIPERIVSLVPSQTELIYALGVKPVGQTLFCKEPTEAFKDAVKVGGTKNLNLDKIRSLDPDLIIANKEENTEEQIKLLQNEFPVWISDVKDLHTAKEMIFQVGSMLQSQKKDALLNQIDQGFEQALPYLGSALYFIWQDPLMVCGRDTFINDMLERAGFSNYIQEASSRYPELDPQQVTSVNPDFVLLSSEPFPFKQEHIKTFRELFPSSEVLLVDATYFSWYGSRLVDAADYIKRLNKNLRRS